MLVLGIDPGLSGGVAALFLNTDCSEIASPMVLSMPVKVIGKKKEVDADALAALLDSIGQSRFDNRPVIKLAAIELVHAMPGQGVTSMFTFGMGYGKVLGVLEALQVPTERVMPQKWKKIVLGKRGTDKKAAIRYCLECFPKANLLATPRSKVPHDGIADALCIAEYARRVLKERLSEDTDD